MLTVVIPRGLGSASSLSFLPSLVSEENFLRKRHISYGPDVLVIQSTASEH